MEIETVKFKQIMSAGMNSVVYFYALDTNGTVWAFERKENKGIWIKIDGPLIKS